MSKQSMVLLVISIYVLFSSFFIEPNSLQVTSYNIQNSQLAGTRIVFLSDFHLKKHDYKRLNKIVKMTIAQNPNAVILGGDFVRQDMKSSMAIGIIASKLSLISVPTLAVLGEADWWADGNSIKSALERNGIKVLENSSQRIVANGRYVDIIGIADITTRQPDIGKAFIRTRTPRIVVTHNPDVYYDIIDSAALILAGHTHGGQFVVPFTPPLFVQSKFGAEFASGLVGNDNNKMIVSRGLGTTGIPVRFNCKPEIVVVNFTN